MAASDKKPDSHLDVTMQDDVAKWHKAEETRLSEKLETARAKPPVLEEKLDQWRSLTERQKKRKCLNRLKAAFIKPHKIMGKLCDRGDDVVEAANEHLKPARIEKIILNYDKVRSKLLDAIEVAKDYNETYPEISLTLGGFDWAKEVPATREKGVLSIYTSNGLQVANLGDQDGEGEEKALDSKEEAKPKRIAAS